MDLTLKRTRADLYGVFGVLLGDSSQQIAITLTHPYLNSDGVYYAKVGPGQYTCIRGTHVLAGRSPFETFEITGVVGHTGLLFHKGNYGTDSEGCELLGVTMGVGCILESEIAFNNFMTLQSGVNSFQLTVQDLPSS